MSVGLHTQKLSSLGDRAVTKGIGLPLLWSQVITLAVFGVTLIALASLRFRKRLD